VTSMAFTYHFVQRSDLLSSAAASAIIMILNRGLLTPYLLCRHLNYRMSRYLAEIAGYPLAAGVLTAGALWLCRISWLPGTTLLQLTVAGALGSALFLVGAGRYCVLAEHPVRVLDLIRQKSPSFEKPARGWLGMRSVELDREPIL